MKYIFLLHAGPNHLLRVSWDKESQVRLCSVHLMVKKTSPGLEFGSVWWSIMVVYSVAVLLVLWGLTAAITGSCVGSPIDFGAIFWKIFLEEKNG